MPVTAPQAARADRGCGKIRTLYNFEPSATEEEVRAAALQYVRNPFDAKRMIYGGFEVVVDV